jgi:hypothetical protein
MFGINHLTGPQMTYEQLRELEEHRHQQKMEQISAEAEAAIARIETTRDANIAEIQAHTEAQFSLNQQKAHLIGDIFQKASDLESHKTQEHSKRIQAETTEHGKRLQQLQKAHKVNSQEQKELESHITQEQRKRINYQMAAQTQDHQNSMQYLDKVHSTARNLLVDSLRAQYISNSLEAGSSSVVIEELSDSDNESSSAPKLIKQN